MTTPQIELTSRFYAWETRGRGWTQWPDIVVLEPAFRRFDGHYLPAPTDVVDDGKRETLLSRFASLFGSSKPPLSGTYEEPSEPRPTLDSEPAALVEMVIALPEGTRVDRDAMDALLISLSGCGAAVAFEVIGTRESIVLQFTARSDDAPLVEEALRAFFPTTSIAQTPSQLASVWSNAGEHCAIVECGLAREFMLPLRTFSRTDPDPLTALFATLGNLADREVAILQILFHATRSDWSSSVKAAVLDADGEPFFGDAPELTHLALEKITHPFFAVVMRIAAASPIRERATLMAQRVGAALSNFARSDGNELVLMGNDAEVDLESDLLARLTHRSGMLLSSGELAGFVHPPAASIVLPKLTRRVRRSKAAPATTGCSILLGTNEHAGRVAQAGLTADQRMRHTHVIGASGMGKSSFLLDLIQQTIDAGEGVAVLDPHGDLVDEVLARVPEQRDDDVVLIDAADGEFAVGLNLLAAHSDQERTLLASDLVAVFRRLATTWGDQMNTVLANAIQAFLGSTEGGSLADLRRFLIESEYRQSFLKTVDDDEIVYYWTREYPLLIGKPAAPILTRLDSFLRPKPLRAMLACRENKVDFRKVMDNGHIFLAKLAEGVIGHENAALLGSVLVAKFHQAAISRQDVSAEARRDFHLVIDEFQELVTPSLAGILSGTRKYRLGLTAAHQDLRQLYAADPPVASALLANAATRVVFRVGDDDAKKLADGFASFDAVSLTTLGVGEAICRIDRADHDFNIQTRRVAPVERAIAESRRARLRDVSNRQYAVPISKDSKSAPSVPPTNARLPIHGRRAAAGPPARNDGLQRLIRDAIDSDDVS